MDKCQDDQWFSDPPSIKSTFVLRLGEIKDVRICTGVCGLGWRFGVSRTHSGSSVSIDSKTPPPENMKVRLEFSFNSPISSLGLSDVSITVKISAGSGGTLPVEIKQKHPVSFGAMYGNWLSLGDYTCVGSPSAPRICSAHVEFTPASGLHLPTTPPPSTLSFLHDSVSGLDRTDTVFYLFSRQNKLGRKTHLLPVFASSQVLRGKSSYLDTRLSFESIHQSWSPHLNVVLTIPGFKESALVDIDSTPLDLANFSDAGYDYDSDSDLDSDDEDEGPNAPDSGDLEDPPRTSGLSTEVAPETKASRRIGRVVWKALIWYLYTSKIDFLPIRSQGPDSPSIALDGYHPTCSPKSMYRLADKLGMLELRSLSLAALGSRLTQSNILQESVCRFTSLYPEVQEVESNYLIAHSASIPSAKFEELQHMLSNGEHPHSLVLLLKLARKSLALPRTPTGHPIQTNVRRSEKGV